MNHSLPAEFLFRLQTIVPSDRWSGVLESFRQPRPTAFRINPLSVEATQCEVHLTQLGLSWSRVPWFPLAGIIPSDQRETLTHSQAVSVGHVFIQGLSSMLVPLVLDPQPGEMVLDLAAAPGAKATQMAAMMQNQGVLSCVEVVRKRMYLLADNLKKCGVSIARTYLTDGRSVGRKTPERFDRVLLDAPCSGESRFREDDPDSWRYWSLRKIKEQARKQHGLIRSAWEALRPGGTLVYSTCSFAPEENESVVAGLLSQCAGAAVIEPIESSLPNRQPGLLTFEGERWPDSLSRCCRILPNETMEGFFLAKISKQA